MHSASDRAGRSRVPDLEQHIDAFEQRFFRILAATWLASFTLLSAVIVTKP